MSDKAQYVSEESYALLKTELDNLKNKKIPEIANRIDEAKQQGDLSENAEYHQAKEDMAWAQGRMLELDQILSNAILINGDRKKNDEVLIGNTVIAKTGDKTKKYTIVGPQEADPFKGKISNESPLGQAFLGKSIDDVVEVATPAGTQKYTIIEIEA
ncbi:MAG: transcription elongation factor GreA [Patescibacteria group bacterium]